MAYVTTQDLRVEPRSAHFDDRADLHGDPAAVDAGPGLGDLDGLVDRVGLDHRVAAERFLGLDERSVGDRTGPDGLRRRRPLELVPAVQLPGRAPLLVPGAGLGVPGTVLGTVRGRLIRCVHDQQHVLHASLLLVVGARLAAPYSRPTNGVFPDPTSPESFE